MKTYESPFIGSETNLVTITPELQVLNYFTVNDREILESHISLDWNLFNVMNDNQ